MMNNLDKFIKEEKHHMLRYLNELIPNLKSSIDAQPEEFKESEDDEPSIDIRLCIDLNDDGTGSWIFRTGDSSYDQQHSQYCSTTSIGIDSNAAELLDYLIQDLDY